MPTSIIIPAYNQLAYCRECVQSVLANTERPYRLILVDNGSTDGVSEYFDTVPGATVLHAPENLGFAGGVNLGLEAAEGHLLLLNSDTVVPAGWLGRLEEALLHSGDVGMVGPMSNCVSGSQQIDGLEFGSIEALNAYARDLAEQKRGVLRDVARLVGFCVLIRDTVAQAVGRFDEVYGIGNFEDDDYCLRVLRAGYRLCVAEDCFVFHYGSRTLLSMGMVNEAWRALIDKNQAIFEAKWQARPEERSDAIQQAVQMNKRAQAALAKGDPAGAIRMLKEAIEVAPYFERNYNDLGVILWEMGKQERAYHQFARALRFNPHSLEARENLRHAAEALDKRAEAETLLGRIREEKT